MSRALIGSLEKFQPDGSYLKLDLGVPALNNGWLTMCERLFEVRRTRAKIFR